MLKKVLPVLFVLSFVASGCGNKAKMYDEAKSYLNEMTTIMTNYTASLESAKDSKAIVTAINSFAKDMKAMIKKGNDLEKKYPEMKSGKKDPKLQVEFKKFEAATEKMTKAQMALLGKYMKDKEVMTAIQNLGKGMQQR